MSPRHDIRPFEPTGKLLVVSIRLIGDECLVHMGTHSFHVFFLPNTTRFES